MSDTAKVMELIKEHDVKYVDFRFTDPRGKWQHLAHHVRTISEDFLNDGVMFDGSSIAGWKAINDSDIAGPLLRRARAVERATLYARPAFHR
jgi:glutamine synthetase